MSDCIDIHMKVLRMTLRGTRVPKTLIFRSRGQHFTYLCYSTSTSNK
jgi:hypothetical protein